MLKLFVVGEASPDPKTWSQWSEYALVIAADADEARRIAGRHGDLVSEIPMDKPTYLVGMTEPDWGEDI